MTDLRDAARQALEALETVFMPHHPAVIALREALTEEALQRLSDANQEIESMIVDEGCFERGCACHDSRESPGVVVVKQPEQEPVACNACVGSIAHVQHGLPIGTKLYTHPFRREWRGLDRDETMHLMNDTAENYWADEAHIQRFARAVEAALKERNA
jgi:hypothetical protein